MIMYIIFLVCLVSTCCLAFMHREVPKHSNIRITLLGEVVLVFIYMSFSGASETIRDYVTLLCIIGELVLSCGLLVSYMKNVKRYLMPEHKITVKKYEDALKYDRHTCECTDRVFCIDENIIKFENGIKAKVKDSSLYEVGKMYSVIGILKLDSNNEEVLHDCMEFYA